MLCASYRLDKQFENNIKEVQEKVILPTVKEALKNFEQLDLFE